MQMQRRAEEEEQKRKDDAERPAQEPEQALPEDLVYVDELQMTEQERQQNRKFRKKDQYHLPDLNMPLSEMGQPNDPRVMSLEELQQYARQFEAGDDINVYNFSKIDFNSPFFTSLPATDRYNILNAARLRSRLRMGYSREQLEAMFPDRMAFSKFQIERVRERNELTQRLMQVGTVEDGTFGTDGNGRVAGEKGREYVLVKNPGVEGGWALGVIGENDPNEGQRSKPIDVDEIEKKRKAQEAEAEAELEEEEAQKDDDKPSQATLKQREEFYKSRLIQAGRHSPPATSRNKKPVPDEDDSLFVSEDKPAPEQQQKSSILDEDSEDEETQLQIAIAMSMQDPHDQEAKDQAESYKPVDVHQEKASTSAPFTSMRGSVASMANKRSRNAAPKRQAPVEPAFVETDSSDDDEPMDLQDALAESRGSKYRPYSPPRSPARASPPKSQPQPSSKAPEKTEKKSTGPLPFEKLDLGSSLLGKKKMKQMEENKAGGFETGDSAKASEKSAVPAPPWFSDDVQKGIEDQRTLDVEDSRRDRHAAEQADYEFQPAPKLRQKESSDVIDVDALEDKGPAIFNVDSDEEDERSKSAITQETPAIDATVRMGDMADAVRAMPPVEESSPPRSAIPPISASTEIAMPLDPTAARVDKQSVSKKQEAPTLESEAVKSPLRSRKESSENRPANSEASDEEIEWSESDHEQQVAVHNGHKRSAEPPERGQSRSASPDDVYMPTEAALQSMVAYDSPSPPDQDPDEDSIVAMSGAADQDLGPEAGIDDDGMYSDPEDEELMQQLATEAEEHARFASTLNHRTQQQNMEDYERELKALRTQQKKDRRDADEVTHIMIQECQQLLKLFGLPYVTAPMEAEAQCAELVRLGLVDGIVTDDSDIFLFGGTRVYKNMFNQSKFVECYLTADLTNDFDLTRNKLINIAHLLGSDYTEGLPGVGPVTALEILTEFTDADGLSEFKEWFTSVQQGASMSDGDRASAFRKKFRKQATKLFLPPSFPDRRVDAAYLKPEVDSDPSVFQWGVPDLDALRGFLMATIGWDQTRTDEVLVPVIRDMNRRETEGQQANITEFLGGGGGNVSVGAGAFAPRVRGEGKSRRMENALGKMAERARRKKKGEAEVEPEPKDRVRNGTADAVIAHAGSAVDGSEATAVNGKAKKKEAKRKTRRPVESELSQESEEEYVDKSKKRKSKGKSGETSKKSKKRRVEA